MKGLEGLLLMNTVTGLAVLVMVFAVTPACAQTAGIPSPNSNPIAGIDDAALARSARASKLIGNKVYKGDTSIGTIEDVMVDLDHATTAAIILSVGGFLGMGDKLVAVPVTQIKAGPEAKFTTDLTKEQLAKAPAFDFAKLK
jgi:sporulation protein YlmC with PRC-barrel domain